MLDVYITIDTEVWCGGWDNLDKRFADSFKSYVYGPTRHGNYALPETLSILNHHGLKAVFFTEPLFSARFGIDPLAEMVGLIADAGQEIQLHLHSEWLNEAATDTPVIEGITAKVPLMTQLSRQQQIEVVRWGAERLHQAGAPRPTAYRAGSYAVNRDTLAALKQNGILVDSSYNPGAAVGVFDIAPEKTLTQPTLIDGITVYPVSVIAQSKGGYRNVQLTALSYREIVAYLEHAWQQQWDSVVLVSHNFELLSPSKQRADHCVRQRFARLCQYLDRHRDRYQVSGLAAASAKDCPSTTPPSSSPLNTLLRHTEQAYRKLCYR